MKTHTPEFKENIKLLGKEIDSKIPYTISGTTTELGNEQLNSVSPHYESAILKSVMKQLDIDSNVEIPVGTELNYKFGVKTRSGKNILINEATTTTKSDVTFTINKDKSITLNGTATANNSIILAQLKVKKDTTYTLSGVVGYSSSTLQLYTISTSAFPSGNRLASYDGVRVRTALEDEDVQIRLYIYSGVTYNNVNVYPMLLEGAYTDATIGAYEQGGAYDYVNYGNYIVKDIEKQEDTNSYKLTCYDKMLYSMVDYETPSSISYPVTVRDYLSAICTHLSITFANSSDTFANYDKIISTELYLSYNDETSTYSSLGYKFRDVLDELAEVTASTICINENDELEVRYINQTIGKNLFSGLIKGIGISATNGAQTTNSQRATSDYIPVNFQENSNYYLSGLTDTLWAFVGAYNSNRQFLGRTGAGATKSFSLTSNSFTNGTPQATGNIAYLRVMQYEQTTSTGTIDDVDNLKIQLEVGSSASEYEPYGDTIDEEYLKDVNVNFGEKFGPVNTIVLSRSTDADNIYYPTILPANPVEIKISDNQIMNGNDRDTYLPDIYNKLNGLEYYINDFSSTGICYYDLCDKYNVKVGDKFYSCIMFNDEVNVTQGLEEQVYTDLPEETNTDYSKADTTDRKINTAYIIANKAEATVQSVAKQYDDVSGRLDAVEIKQTSTEATIDIISTNIDQTTGDINSVTTKEKKFTFNDSGLAITNSVTNFKSLQDETGTYYYDGTDIVGQYTKDGSKQKDLQLFGVYYYGMNSRTDNPRFVAQLYTDNDNEEAFGHFWNGGDY